MIDDAADLIERGVHAVRHLFRDQQHTEIAAVVGELHAEAIQNAPARRRNQPLADPVLVRLRLELIAFKDLELVQSAAQHGENSRHAA